MQEGPDREAPLQRVGIPKQTYLRFKYIFVTFVFVTLTGLSLSSCDPSGLHRPSTHAESASTSADWPVFGHDPGGTQFSPLHQITRDNVRQLTRAWVQRSGDLKSGPTGTSLEVTPLFVNKSIYYCTPLNRVFALDPDTGAPRWIFDPYAKGPGNKPVITGSRLNGICRGVAYWEDNASVDAKSVCKRRIFKGDKAGRLFAIDADTGQSCLDFGPKSHPGYVSHLDYETYGKPGLGIDSPPAVVGDLVIVGGVANDGIQNSNNGVVRAFDARTGTLRWEFNPIPPAYRRLTGAANVWSTISVDIKNHLVFLPTTSPSTDYYGGRRKFDMPLTNAVVAVNADTGKVVWSYQTVRHDLWDYDLPGHPLLVTINKDGRPRDVVIQQTKTGHLFVFDRLTGKPVFPIRDIAVPASPLKDEKAAQTQPLPVLPEPFARTSIKRSELFGIVGLDKLWCQHTFDKTRYSGIFTPPGVDDYLELPSTLGGGNWGGAAFDPATNSIIVKASNIATRLHLVRKDPRVTPLTASDFMNRPLEGPYGITGTWFVSPLGIPCTPPPYGTLTSIDMGSGKIRWQKPLGQTHRYGVTVPAVLGWGSPSIGGPIVTAGGLVFMAGTLDSHLRAFDTRTGQELWAASLPAPGMATPMTYMTNGRQYVLVAAGGNAGAGTKQGDWIVAYALK